MNVLDSELVLGQLRAQGYQSTDDREDADVIIYNTCSVREHAEQKVWSRLGELRNRKAAQPHLVIGVIGCMAERDGQNIFKKYPHVDILCGPGELDKLPSMVHNAAVTGLREGEAPSELSSAFSHSPGTPGEGRGEGSSSPSPGTPGEGGGEGASGFWAFATAGEKLAKLHLDYEKLKPHDLDLLETPGLPLSYRIEDKMRLSKDKLRLTINPSLTLSGIPPDAFNYRLGNRSALEWVIDQYQVSTDKRSGITSDPNRDDDPEYIVRLVAQVVRVSMETVKIVGSLPKEFEPAAK
jgi:hypothetical protein